MSLLPYIAVAIVAALALWGTHHAGRRYQSVRDQRAALVMLRRLEVLLDRSAVASSKSLVRECSDITERHLGLKRGEPIR